MTIHHHKQYNHHLAHRTGKTHRLCTICHPPQPRCHLPHIRRQYLQSLDMTSGCHKDKDHNEKGTNFSGTKHNKNTDMKYKMLAKMKSINMIFIVSDLQLSTPENHNHKNPSCCKNVRPPCT